MGGAAVTNPRRVLHVIGAMDRGGAETLIMNLYRNIDRSLIQFDFLVHEHRACDYDSEIEDLGGKIYRLNRFNGLNLISYANSCRTFFNEHHDYLAVHVHIGSCAAIVLRESKRVGLFGIAHSHATDSPEFSIRDLFYKLVSYPVRYLADWFLACSRQAGIDRFGSRIADGSHFSVLNNGIDTQKYMFDVNVRELVRQELGVDEDTAVLCHVGRFAPEKNHGFLIDFFYEWLEKHPRSILILAGRGPLEKDVREQVASYGIQNKVRFLGVRSDIPQILMAADLLVFPSVYEGLGIAVIEAQATGLPCLVSDALPGIAFVLPSTIACSLDDSCNDWVAAGSGLLKSVVVPNRSDCARSIRESGFDINDSVRQLVELYFSHAVQV